MTLILKILVTAGRLRAGALGGVLTPSLMIGALPAVVLGGLWNLAGPTEPAGAFAIVGSAAFLASSMRMPLTAIASIVEVTHVDHDFLILIVFAVAGSAAIRYVSAAPDRTITI